RYRYRLEIVSGDSALSLASGRQFLRMIQVMLPKIPEHKLDARACELRDHLGYRKAVRAEAERLGIAPTAVLQKAREAAEKRIGESFLEYCDPPRAAKIFRRALDVDENSYRAQLGLAEVALSDGKLAHVIHHYNDAVRIAPDKAAARLARREAEYYSRLNNDEDYLAAEVRRMNWLESAGRIQRLTARASFAALLVALVGSSLDQFVGGIGWAIASSSIIAWSGSLLVRRLLSTRRRLAVDG